MQEIERELEALRQELPDPLAMLTELEAWFALPAAARLIEGGDATIDALLGWLRDRPHPALVRVAILLLSRLDPARFYPRLLSVLANADTAMVTAFDAGWWLIEQPHAVLARDVVRVAREADNPALLQLLQHPAAREVKPELVRLIRGRTGQSQFALFALYALRYALDPGDAPLLREVSAWNDFPQAADTARELLTELGGPR